MLKTTLLVSAALLLVLAPAATMGGRPQEGTAAKSTGKITAEVQAKAKKVYAQDCALCHADNGNGQSDIGKSMNVADWTKPETLANKTDEALIDLIRKGKGNMPPEAEGRADDLTMKGIIAYIRALSKGEAK
jgi:cytochrome c5